MSFSYGLNQQGKNDPFNDPCDVINDDHHTNGHSWRYYNDHEVLKKAI